MCSKVGGLTVVGKQMQEDLIFVAQNKEKGWFHYVLMSIRIKDEIVIKVI